MCLLAFTACCCALLLSVRADVVCLPRMLAGWLEATYGEVHQARQTVDELPGLVDRQATAITAAATGEIRHLGDGALVLVADSAAEALATAQGAADNANSQITGIRADLKPTLTSTAALLDDARNSWDDLYPDVKGSVASATVAITSVAQASESVRAAAPQLVESAGNIGHSADGITADVHTATTDFVRPKTRWQKLRAWLETAGKVAARFL